MRATINFDVDIDRVNETMMELVSTQVEYLIDAAEFIRKCEDSQSLLEVLSESLEKIEREAAQLRQYRDMLASFEKARLETMLPQPADDANLKVQGDVFDNLNDLRESLNKVKDFKNFLTPAAIPPREEEEDDDPQEG